MTSKTFNLNIFRWNEVGRPKTFNLNILKEYKVKLMCGEKPETFNLIVLKTMQVNWNIRDTYNFFAGRFCSPRGCSAALTRKSFPPAASIPRLGGKLL